MSTIFGVRAVFGVSVSLGDKSANGSQTLLPEVNRRSVSNGEVQSNDAHQEEVIMALTDGNLVNKALEKIELVLKRTNNSRRLALNRAENLLLD